MILNMSKSLGSPGRASPPRSARQRPARPPLVNKCMCIYIYIYIYI